MDQELQREFRASIRSFAAHPVRIATADFGSRCKRLFLRRDLRPCAAQVCEQRLHFSERLFTLFEICFVQTRLHIEIQLLQLFADVTTTRMIEPILQFLQNQLSFCDRLRALADRATFQMSAGIRNSINRALVGEADQLQRRRGQNLVLAVRSESVGSHRSVYKMLIGRKQWVVRCLPLPFLIVSTYAQTTQKSSDASQSSTTQQQASVIVTKQTTSVDKMAASLDQQKAAISKQLGIAPQASSFFSTAWSSAPMPPPLLNPTCPAMSDDDLKPLISQSAQTQSVQPELVRAVIRRESASYPCAVSDRGALGLMQLMPDVADQFNVDPLDPKQNVEAGTKYLKQLLTRYKGDVKLALAAYNAGPQRVDAENKVPNIPETTAYVDAILKDLKTSAAVKK